MHTVFLLAVVAALVIADHAPSKQLCTKSEEKLCGNFRLPNGTMTVGHLDKMIHAFNLSRKVLSDHTLRINNCVAPAVDKDPCSSSLCNSSEDCQKHPYNLDHECDCSFGFYGVNCGLAWNIGLVDRYNSFSIIALSSFKQQNKTIIYPPEHARKPFKTTLPVPVYDPTNELFYFVGNEIIYRGKLGDEYMEPIYILTGYTESEEASSNTGGGIVIDNDMGYLYVGHKIEGSIKRYPVPSLGREEIFFRPNDSSTWERVSALGISHAERLLYWMDFKGITRCSLENCSPRRIYNFSFETAIDSFYLAVDDKSAKMFWNERTDLDMSIIKMAELDGTFVDAIWEEDIDYLYMISHIGWLVRYDIVTRHFWYVRIGDYVSGSRRRSFSQWEWKSSPVPEFYSVSSMFSI